jgi:hypothetical protein
MGMPGPQKINRYGVEFKLKGVTAAVRCSATFRSTTRSV